tara:strand:+ start:1778 stop:2704 length:927 start_codon:yes stop_codon:yes gene_type:complete
MANLNVDEIEASGTNENVKISTQGTNGALEVKGASNDGTLQLNCSNNSHGVKLKSPANSAGQNHTIILPDNQIAAGKLLKVKSIAGSGSTAVGQLEYADLPASDVSSLNASNFTSGTVPTARYSLDGSVGAGYQLISKQTVSSDDTIQQIDFTSLADNGMYKMIIKEANTNSGTNYIHIQWLDSSNNVHDNISYYRWDDNDDNLTSSTDQQIPLYVGANFSRFYFDIEFYTATRHTVNHTSSGSNTFNKTFMLIQGHGRGNDDNKCEVYAGFNNATDTDRIHGVRITVSQNGYLQSGTQILLYKYNES